MEMVVQHVPGTILVELPGPTRGAAETVRIGLEGLTASQRSRPTMLVDGDAFYTVDIVSMYRAISATSGGSFCFRDTQPKPIYSYVTCVRGVRTIASIDASRRWRAGGVDVRPPRRHRRGRVTRSTPSATAYHTQGGRRRKADHVDQREGQDFGLGEHGLLLLPGRAATPEVLRPDHRTGRDAAQSRAVLKS